MLSIIKINTVQALISEKVSHCLQIFLMKRLFDLLFGAKIDISVLCLCNKMVVYQMSIDIISGHVFFTCPNKLHRKVANSLPR